MSSDFGRGQLAAFRHSLAVVRHSFAAVRHSFAVVRHSFAVVRYSIAVVRHSFAVVRHSLAVVRHSFADVRHSFAVVRHSFAVVRCYLQPLDTHLAAFRSSITTKGKGVCIGTMLASKNSITQPIQKQVPLPETESTWTNCKNPS